MKKRTMYIRCLSAVLCFGMLTAPLSSHANEVITCDDFEVPQSADPLSGQWGGNNIWRRGESNIGGSAVPEGTIEMAGLGYIKRIEEPSGNHFLELKSENNGHTLITANLDLKSRFETAGVLRYRVRIPENCPRAVFTLEQLTTNERHYILEFRSGNQLALSPNGQSIGTYQYNVWYDIAITVKNGTMSIYMTGEDGSVPFTGGQNMIQSTVPDLFNMHFRAFVNNSGGDATGAVVELDDFSVYRPKGTVSATASDIHNAGEVEVTFHQDMDISTLALENFAVTDATGTAVPLSNLVFCGNRTVKLIPATPFSFGTNYTITVSPTAQHSVKNVTGGYLNGTIPITVRARRQMDLFLHFFKNQTRLSTLQSGLITVVPLSQSEQDAGIVSAVYDGNGSLMRNMQIRPPQSQWTLLLDENFENGLSNWSVITETGYSTGTPPVTGTGRSGGSAYGPLTGKMGLVHDFGGEKNGIVEVWMYDDAGDTVARTVCHAGPKTTNGSFVFMGVHTDKSKDRYVYRIGTSTAPIQVTAIPRTTGWHKLTFDYTSNEDVKLFIDGKFAGASTAVKTFGTIRLMDPWGYSDAKYANRIRFDDVKAYTDVEPIRLQVNAAMLGTSIGVFPWENSTTMKAYPTMQWFGVSGLGQ